jgi:hypothetical protein
MRVSNIKYYLYDPLDTLITIIYGGEAGGARAGELAEFAEW